MTDIDDREVVMESINTINKTLFGAALAVFALVMAVPQGTALARGGMELRTADLCLVNDGLDEYQTGGIGTVAAVTDNRSGITAWAVSLEELEPVTAYAVYTDTEGVEGTGCKGEPVYSFTLTTDSAGYRFENSGGPRPEVGQIVTICRMLDGGSFSVSTEADDLIPILEGVLVKGGKEKNKPNRC